MQKCFTRRRLRTAIFVPVLIRAWNLEGEAEREVGMEESKAAAYYDELTRKGEGAARFKQGLGFSSSDARNDSFPGDRGSALPSSSSLFSSFIRASSPSKALEFQKQAQLEAIQSKLKKKKSSSIEEGDRRSRNLDRGCSGTSPKERDLSRDRGKERNSRRRSVSRERMRHSRRSRSRESYRLRDGDRQRRRRSRSRSDSDVDRRKRGSSSPQERRRWEKSRTSSGEKRRDVAVEKQKKGGVDYLRLIEGYDKMTPAEKVKAKMKLQLNETVENDETKGMGSGWERFEFNKDAPLEDEEVEVAEDDTTLVNHISQSFRFSAVEARREEQTKAAHDEAMFGTPKWQSLSSVDDEVEVEKDKEESKESDLARSLLSEKVLAKQSGSWRDRARKV